VWFRLSSADIIGILESSLDEDGVNPTMEDAERSRLLSKHRTPRFRIDSTVFCEVQREMVIIGMTDAAILCAIDKGSTGFTETLTPIPRVRVVLDQRPTAFDKHDRCGPGKRETSLAEHFFQSHQEFGLCHGSPLWVLSLIVTLMGDTKHQ
jgi:hypothetical protein